jgi:hypothetical protein
MARYTVIGAFYCTSDVPWPGQRDPERLHDLVININVLLNVIEEANAAEGLTFRSGVPV